MNTLTKRNGLFYYFLLVIILSIPFWLISALFGNKLPIPMNLPISAFMFINPAVAASLLLYQRDGFKGVKQLFQKTWDARKINNTIWYVPVLLLIPLIYFLSYAVMRWSGMPLPNPVHIPFLLTPVLFIAYFIAAAGEELGWTGYAIDPLQNRWGAFAASLIVAVIWQIWHIIGDLQANETAVWILWHSLYSVALRILIVWFYNNTGKSVFAAILVHTTDNVSWSLFPNFGSGFDPLIASVIAWIIVAFVVFAWGAKTLARYRYSCERINE